MHKKVTLIMAKNKKGVGNKSAAKNSVNLEVSCNPALNPEFLSNELKSNFLSAYKSKSAFGKGGLIILIIWYIVFD